MISSVAVLAYEGVSTFGLGVTAEIFGCDRSAEGLPSYEYTVTAAAPGVMRTDVGLPIVVEAGLDRLSAADLGIVVCWDQTDVLPPQSVCAALRAITERGGRVLSQCTGAFVLAAAGLLDGRRATTHWMYADELARRYPQVKVDPDVLYVDEGPVITSAGTAAGIDACLHLIRREQGSRVANGIARRMVVPPHRDGGQAQYVERPLTEPAADTVQDILNWLTRQLAEPVTVDQLAARAFTSPRTIGRRFVQETGTTPQRWLTGQRILLAQQLLEETDETVDEVAARSGFGNAGTLRHHFRAWRSTTPLAYRRVFRDRSGAAGGS